jgi:hypothetical protein
MKATDDLLELIRSLSRHEKRYVRLFLARRLGKDATACTKLFDMASRLAAGDTDSLRRKVREESFAAHLHVTRHHLYNLILKALRDYDAGATTRSKVREMIESAHALYTRGLFAQCAKLVAKGYELASRHELFAEQLELLDLRGRLGVMTGASDAIDVTTEQHARHRVLLGQIANTLDVDALLTDLTHLLNRRGKPRNGGELEDFDAVMRHPLLQNIDDAPTNKARWTCYDCYRTYYLATRDYARGYHNSLRMIGFIESGKLETFIEEIDYAVILMTHITICLVLGKEDEAEATEMKLRSIRSRSAATTARLQQLVARSHTSRMMNRNDLAGAAAMGEKLLAMQSDPHAAGSPHAPIVNRFYVAFLHFLNGDPDQALQRLLPLLNGIEEVRPDIQMWGRLLHLMIHYDLGNIDLLPYLWRSAYRTLRKRNALHRMETIILNFLRRLVDVRTDGELRETLRGMVAELEELEKDPYESEPLKQFYLIPWIEKKLSQKRSILPTIKPSPRLAQRRAATALRQT